ncbi:MAG TPA: glutaminyl-peptide cyclotransferase [Chryseosolibacter sp.]
MKRSIIVLLAIAVLVTACGKKDDKAETKNDPLLMSYGVRAQWPHDTQAFTQGLVIHEGKLYESTGQEGESWVGVIDVKTGKPEKKVDLPKEYFGEGITILNNKIYQLTWTSKIGFIYDLETFKRIGTFDYTTAGWGITHDTKNLIMSDGSNKLTYLDTVSLKPVRTLSVTDDNGPVKDLNELEYIEGFIFANIWQTNNIVKIDPQSGKVVGRLDLSQLARDAQMRSPRVDVLNGIAYHPTTKMVLVTGKYWPMTYVIQLR